MPQQPTRLAKTKPILSIDATNLAKPVVVPTILITPPDAPPHYSSSIPEQQYEKSVLFVPVKTEELGWDEHGLYWNGTYAYPVHQIYNKQGMPIGRRRKGPQGYRFEEYYDNKQPRRCSSQASSSFSSALLDDTVEEANVRLEEPAPARIEKLASAAVPEEHDEASTEAALDEEDDIASPSSPAMSIASDVTETEDGSSLCDDSNSLWSRFDADSDDDDAESRCTSPGLMSPPMDLDETTPALQAETLSKKLSDLDAGDKVAKNTWVSLGTLPSSSSPASSRSQSLPEPRLSRSKPLEISRNHRATSTLIMEPIPNRDSRRHSGSAYTSIIQDLTTSPFASRDKTPYRSATLPRSSSRSGYAAARSGNSLLRPPPQFASNTGREVRKRTSEDWTGKASRGRLAAAAEPDFAAGWTFENAASMPLINDY